jgi:RND family efflux transporter MFP subunit
MSERNQPGLRRHRAPLLKALLAALLGLNACHRERPVENPPKLPPVTVKVAMVESRPRMAMEEVVGSVRASLHSTIEAKVSGKIARMLAVPGQTVKTGDLLAELDVLESKARLDQALAVNEQARQELRRATGLLNDKTISQQEFDLAQSRARVAEAAVAEAETMLGYAKIVAPFPGLVARKLADVGELASPGKPLVELEDPSSLRLEADIPEALIDRIKLGERYSIRISSLTNTLEGLSSELTPVADPASRTFLAKFDLPVIEGLRLGQFGRVLVPVGAGAALRVPSSALVQRGQMELVFVVVEGQAQLRLIRTGKRIDNEVEVVSGLIATEQVVSEKPQELTDGQPVLVR